MWRLTLIWSTVIVCGTHSRSIKSIEENPVGDELECTCDKRYWSHYEAKGCYPVYEKNNSICPTRFECFSNQTNDNDKCIYKGQYYEIGSSINTGNNCQKCQCAMNKKKNKPYIACAVVECSHFFHQKPVEKGCRLVYEENQCCPINIECELEKIPKCEWKNKTYYMGEHIYPEEDPCLICLCNKDWKGLDSNNCHRIDCIFEKKLDNLKKGCIPVYHEKSCCPIEYYCPKFQELSYTNESETKEKYKNECYFDGKKYKIGEKLNYKQDLNCTTCTCCTPPDFTCIHQSCPSPPNNDYEHCEANYKPGICCPDYECKPIHRAEELILSDQSILDESINIGPPPSEDPCNDMECTDGKHCQLRQVKCNRSFCPVVPTCIDVIPECPTPLCAAGCFVKDNDRNGCPTCVCETENAPLTDLKICVLPNCTGHNCYYISGEDGCPVCSCDPPCKACSSDCQEQTDVPEGKCPICICNEIVESSNIAEIITCQTPVCEGVNCHIKIDENSCTQCICEPECIIPNCEPGCELEIDIPIGSCPKCNCSAVNNKTTCPTSLCEGANCTTMIREDNCSICICSPVCESIICKDNCTLEKNVSKDECPKCICEDNINNNASNAIINSAETLCPAPDCRGYNCRILVELNGCQTCTCESRCPPTSCIPGCVVEENPSPDKCPGCICHLTAKSEDPKSNEW